MILTKRSVIYMTAAAQQRIMNVVKDLPDDAEGAVIDFMINYMKSEDMEAQSGRLVRTRFLIHSWMRRLMSRL